MRPCREAYYQPSDSLKIKTASVEPQPDIKSQCISSSSDLFPLCSNTFTTCSISIKPLLPLFRLCLFPLKALVPVTWNATACGDVNKIRHFGCSSFPDLVMVPEGPATFPDAILQMAFVFDSFRFSTWVFSDWSSRFQGNSTGDFHNALFLLSGLETVGLHYS